MLKLCDIVKNYPTATTTVQALRGVSLTFREHEFVAILGPSGCGKTTMLNIIGGLDRYTSGDLVIGGVSTASFDETHWDAYRNATIGFVFQSYNLIPHLTVLENVELALSLVGEKKKVRRAKAIEALHKVGMDDEITKRPNQLSGGQMQRVAIARAIVNDPKIILADEPTGALDSELSVQVMDILREIANTRLVIMVTHNGELAKEYATRICRFKDGHLIEDTNPYDEHIEQIAIEEVEEQNDEAAAESGKAADGDSIASEEKAAELLTTDTVSLAEEPKAQHNAVYANAEHTLEPAQEVNYEEHSLPEDVHEDKKISNRKRKKQMKRLHVDSSAVFEKLGLNSLSKQKKKAEKKNKTFKPTSMSAGMAFGLSIRNLVSKKRRTFLTAFAGSIGIIGLGLVLSISNGFNLFVENMQRESLASVPLCVYEYNVSPSAFMDMMSAMMDSDVLKPEKPVLGDDITVSTDDGGLGALGVPDMFIPMMNGLIKSFFENVTKNDLSEGFDQYMKGIPDEYAEAVTHYYGVRYNLIGTSLNADGSITYKDVSQQPDPSSVMTISMSILGGSGVQPEYWQMLVGGEDTMLKAYDLVGENSRYPQNKNEIVLCIGSDNKIDKKLLDTFGITMNAVNKDGEIETLETLNSDFFIGKTLKLVHNDNYFEYIPSRGIYLEADNSPETLEGLYNDPSSVELKIVGVIRQKQEVSTGYVTSSLCYTPELSEYVLEQAYNSEVAKAQQELMRNNPNSNATVFGNESVYGSRQVDDDFTNDASIISVMNNKLGRSWYLKAIGAIKAPTFVKVYTATYDQKLGAGDYIKDWNTKHKDSIGYFDTSEMFIYNLLLVIDLVSIILIAVASISLVVSTVMIGVITSNSVVERTREIGILRSLGARRKDIRNVFIAETSLIGLSGGVIGIVLTYILCPIISLVIGAISGVGNLLHFHPLHALALVAISLVLTVISGIVPAIGASRKNVVDALRVD